MTDGGSYQTVHRSKLKESPYNPRKIDTYARKNLAASVKATGGLVQPPIWNKRTGHIVGGHQRLSVLDEQNGGTDYALTVVVVDWDEAKERETCIRLNNLTSQGMFDTEQLFDLLGPSADVEIDLSNTGFNVTDLEALSLDSGVDMPSWLVPEVEQETAGEYDSVADDVEAALDEADEAKADEKESEKIAEFKRKKRDAAEKSAFETQQTFVRLVFGTTEQLQAFLNALDQPDGATFIDGVELAKRLKINLE